MAVGIGVELGEAAEVAVAGGNGVIVGVVRSRGMGMDSLQEAASKARVSAVGKRHLASLLRTLPTGLGTCMSSYIEEL
ncbi:MAG TPA: hypothetical protein VMW58_13270 [Anaerolineae bacterium]|nr:hypothetical protein [Anaerolineae bacterium]